MLKLPSCARNAVITGSTSGIGLGIARALAREGVNVVLNGLGEKNAIEETRAGLEKEFGVKVQTGFHLR